MNEFELQQMLEQMQMQGQQPPEQPQFQQGLLGSVQTNPDLENLAGKGAQSAQMMAQQGDAGSQQALQQAAQNKAMQEQANQQAIAEQQKKQQQMMSLAMNFIPRLGAVGGKIAGAVAGMAK